MSEWVSVEDRLPEIGEWVLCWIPKESFIGHEYGMVIILSRWKRLFRDEYCSIFEPSHWMKLPEPPK